MTHRTHRRSTIALGLLAIVSGLAPAPPAEGDEARAFAEQRIQIARRVLDLCKEFLVAPPGSRDVPAPFQVAEEIQYWSRQLADARLEATDDRAAKIAILTEEVQRARDFAVTIKDLQRGESTGITKLAEAKADYYRVDSEARLSKAKLGR